MSDGAAIPRARRGLTAALALAAALTLGVGCDRSGRAPGTGGASPAAFCAPSTVLVSTAGDGAFLVESAHYRLRAEATEDEAVAMGRLLEAAYGAFAAWFQATPPLGTGERLRVKYYADQASWARGLAADGLDVPMEAGGFFTSATGTAYLFRQGNPYYSHVLLLHEATHQFHELARTAGRTLPFWYAEGQAEYLSRHDWDDQCVRLGAIPLLGWEDLAAHAFAEEGATESAPGIDVAAIVSGAAPASRAASWALFRYLDTGARRDAFRAFRDAIDADARDPARTFATLVGDPGALSAPLSSWLAGAQEPLTPVFTEWIPVGPRAVIADSPEFFSLALVKGAATHFEAGWDAPADGSWSAGAVIAYQDDRSYQAILVSPEGKLRAFTASAGGARWSDAGRVPPAAGGEGRIAVDHGPGSLVTLVVNGATVTRSIGALPPALGPAVSDSRVSFHDLAWR